MAKNEILYHGMIGNNIEIQHERHQVPGSANKIDVLQIAHNEEKVLQGMMVNYSTMGPVLEVAIHQPKQDLTTDEYLLIFVAAAGRMGTNLGAVRPAFYNDPTHPDTPRGLAALAKMRQALGLE